MLHWHPDPVIFSIGSFAPRWYGVLFAVSFLFGHRFIRYAFAKDGIPDTLVDRLLVYMMVGTVVGARLGHCLFYEPSIYLADPIRILKVWEGGLASHGAAIGIITALYLFAQKYPIIAFVPLLDRIAIPVALAGGFIRIGNFFNSEIIGKPANLPWAVVFDRVDQVPRHPAQLYESFCYFSIFAFLFWLFARTGARKKPGLIFGIYMVLIFGARFALEFFKENQVAFESRLPLNMGQLLSIPAVAIGIWIAVWAWRRPAVERPAAA